MSPVLVPPRRHLLTREHRRDVVGIIAVGAFYLLALVAVAPGLRGPSFIDELIVENPHPWAVNVEVSDPSRRGWIAVGSLARESGAGFRSVIDQGDQWVFRFSYGGIDAGELEVTRAELGQSRWRITVPDEFVRRMRAGNVDPSA